MPADLPSKAGFACLAMDPLRNPLPTIMELKDRRVLEDPGKGPKCPL